MTFQIRDRAIAALSLISLISGTTIVILLLGSSDLYSSVLISIPAGVPSILYLGFKGVEQFDYTRYTNRKTQKRRFAEAVGATTAGGLIGVPVGIAIFRGIFSAVGGVPFLVAGSVTFVLASIAGILVIFKINEEYLS
ncbi:hypothetical protein [Halorussus ruber]|uniref:hypothetical protein n=1 Tax=Halorussus ruber TaxID=1126238 RepID=UPI001091C8AE|nr:hypothetical protein [Halorussus ruber]